MGGKLVFLYIYIYISLSLSIYLSIYLPTYLPIYLSIYLSILYIYIDINIETHISFFLSLFSQFILLAWGFVGIHLAAQLSSPGPARAGLAAELGELLDLSVGGAAQRLLGARAELPGRRDHEAPRWRMRMSCDQKPCHGNTSHDWEC